MQAKLPWIFAALLGLTGFLIGYSVGDTNFAGKDTRASEVRAKPALIWSTDSGATPAADPETAALVKDFEQAAASIMEDSNHLRQAHRLFQMVEHLSAEEMPGALNAALHLDQ